METTQNNTARPFRFRRVPIFLAVLALTAGCTDDAATGDMDGEELTSVTVGALPIASSVELRFGVEQGIFEEHGLDIELTEGDGGAALLPAVHSGSIDIAVGNPMSVLVAADQGLPMKIVSGYSWSAAEGDDINALVAREDSNISTFSDLEGQTVSVNALNTLGDLATLESVNLDGGDPSDVTFNEMPFPEMHQQLEQGSIDAMWVPEPFLGDALEDPDNEVVGYPNQTVMPGMPLTVAFTSEEFAEEGEESVAAFYEALNESIELAWEDEDELRASIPEFLEMDEETAERIAIEPADTDLPVDRMQTIYDLMLEYDMAADPLDVEELYIDR